MRLDRRWLVGLLAALVVGVAILFTLRRSAHVQYLTVAVDRGDIRDVVEATGTIKAVVLVQVGSQVSGRIAKLNVDFNSQVKSGDVVALIDPALFEGALKQAQADLDSARANVVSARANVEKARATLLQSQLDYDRAVQITEAHFQPQQFLDQAKAAHDGASAGLAAAQAGVTQAEAQVRQKEAAVTVAQTNRDYTVIRSPIDGTVVARNVDVGQTVAASLQAPTIFDIAQDLTKMRVYAKTDESEVGRIKVGQPVMFKVDAFPKETFKGVVSQIRMNATSIQNVVTYDSIVDFDNPDLKLFPGMTAYVTIPVAAVESVLRVPNTALRFEPPLTPVELQALYAKQGIALRDQNPGGPSNDGATVWKLLPDSSLQPARITVGTTDHAYTQVLQVTAGTLAVDDLIVTAFVAPKTSSPPR